MRSLTLKTVFLIDAIGAVVTSFLLAAVLRTFNEYFGMPKNILSLLSIVAIIFAAYSFSCFVFLKQNSQNFLKPIILANFSYCILTGGLIVYFKNQITLLGIAYFIGEILVVFAVIYIELRAVKQFTA